MYYCWMTHNLFGKYKEALHFTIINEKSVGLKFGKSVINGESDHFIFVAVCVAIELSKIFSCTYYSTFKVLLCLFLVS